MSELHTGIAVTTVRSRLIERIRSAIASLDMVGQVDLEGEVDVEADTASIDSSVYVVMVVGDDEVVEQRQSGLVEKAFGVALVAALPTGDVPQNQNGADPGALASPAQIASEFCSRVSLLYATESPSAEGPDWGTQWGGLAVKTDELGGGGVGFEEGRAVTSHALRITYRHWYGDPSRAPSEPAGGG
ncbi:MAG: hypothetical protein AAGI53_01670 [Planctomycetota bacterium]